MAACCLLDTCKSTDSWHRLSALSLQIENENENTRNPTLENFHNPTNHFFFIKRTKYSKFYYSSSFKFKFMMEELMGSSGITSRFSADQEETSNLMETESKLCDCEWTNEKHSLYLKNMEATFVNQLYKSIDLVGWRSQNNVPSKSKSLEQKETSVGSACGQFKICQNGGWSNINFRRDGPEVGQDKEFGVLLANPWIQHYRHSQRKEIKISPSSRAKGSPMVNQSPSNHFGLRHQDSKGSNAEVTDQNFNDEDLEEEKKAGGLHEMKRKKTSTDTISRNEVVLLKNIAENDSPTKEEDTVYLL